VQECAMSDVLATTTTRSGRQLIGNGSLSLTSLPKVTAGSSLTSSLGFAGGVDVLRQHCDDLIQASSASLTQCGALQCTTFKLGTAFVQAAVSLADLFAPSGVLRHPALLEELCTHLTALQAEAEVVASRVNKLAAAHCEYSFELQKFVTSVSPGASFVTLDARLHDVALVLPEEDPKAALRDLAEQHMHAMLKTEGAYRVAPALWRTIAREQAPTGTSSSSTSSSAPVLPKLETTGSPSKRLGAQAAIRINPLRGSPQKGSKSKVADAAAQGAALSRQHGLTVLPLRAEVTANTGVDREGFLRAQLADTSAELGSLRAQLEQAKAELALVGVRRRDKAQLPMFTQTSAAGFPSLAAAPAAAETSAGSRRGSGQSSPHGVLSGSGSLDDIVCPSMKIDLAQTCSGFSGSSSTDALKLSRLRHDMERESKELMQVRRQLVESSVEIDALRAARAEDSVEMQRLANDLEQMRKEAKLRLQQLQRTQMQLQTTQLELQQTQGQLRSLQEEALAQTRKHQEQSKELHSQFQAKLQQQELALQKKQKEQKPVEVVIAPTLNTFADKELMEEVRRRKLLPPPEEQPSKKKEAPPIEHPKPVQTHTVHSHHQPVLSRSSSKVRFPSKDSLSRASHHHGVSRAKIRRLWQQAAKYGWDLLRVGNLEPHERPVAFAMEELCKKFECYFHDRQIGIHEFMAAHSREQEFKAVVSNLIGSYAAGTLISSASIDLRKLEDAMLNDYNKGFEMAGGQAVAEKFFPEVNSVLRKLRRLRGTHRFKQDVGFEILGLDQLYETVGETNHKLVHEVSRLAKGTVHRPSGNAICPSLKGRSRARAKMLTKYGNDPACLTDLMRASITYPRISDLYRALVAIIEEDLDLKRRDFFILEVNDRFQNSKDGYRDISMLVNVDGVIGEVQLHVQSVLNAKKSKGHDVYKKQRLINESLFEACVRANEDMICALAREHHICALNVRDKYGRSALHYCCQVGLVKATILLMQFGADPWVMDVNGIMACELAIRGGHWDVTETVLAKMQQTKEDRSAQLRRLAMETVPWLCDHIARAPPVERLHRHELLTAGRELVSLIQQHGADQPLQDWLLDAATNGDMLRVRTLLELDFDFHPAPGQSSALDLAIENCHAELAQMLSTYPPSERRPAGFSCARCYRHTLEVHLKIAAQSENAECAKVALSSKADPNRTTAFAPGRRSPLMAFAASGKLEMCEILVKHRAQVDWFDQFGCGAVHYALALNHIHVVEYLEGIKALPSLGIKDDKVVDVTFLSDGITQGCAAAVWRYVRKLEGGPSSPGGMMAEPSVVLSRVIANHNQTALHLAVHSACKGVDPSGQVCKALLRYKANMMARRINGDTPLHIAAASGHHPLYTILRKAASEAEDVKAQHGLQLVVLDIEQLKNDAGQSPKELLERMLTRHEELQHAERMEEAMLLLTVGFFALRNATMQNKLHGKLQVWRHDTAPTWFEFIRQRKDKLKSINLEELGRTWSDGDLDGGLDDVPFLAGTLSSDDGISPRAEDASRKRGQGRPNRASVFSTSRRDLNGTWLSSSKQLKPQQSPTVKDAKPPTPSAGARPSGS